MNDLRGVIEKDVMKTFESVEWISWFIETICKVWWLSENGRSIWNIWRSVYTKDGRVYTRGPVSRYQRSRRGILCRAWYQRCREAKGNTSDGSSILRYSLIMKIPDNTLIRPVYFPDTVCGASMVKGDTWCIGVADRLGKFERERIVAHEIGHLYDGTCGIDHPLAERRAEDIARELLIPEYDLRKYIEDGFTTISELRLFFPSATPEMIERTCTRLQY